MSILFPSYVSVTFLIFYSVLKMEDTLCTPGNLPSRLIPIVERKHMEVLKLKEDMKADDKHPLHAIIAKYSSDTPSANPLRLRRFENSLKEPGLSVIAEIKRQSPSAGVISAILNPSDLAVQYEVGGASCISCLTDSAFGGSLADLDEVVSRVTIPVLRKDFTVDAVQIAEAKLHGASCVLLMVSVLGEQVSQLLKECEKFDLDALVEIHNEEELKVALHSGARIIGCNNRDLHTFTTDLNICARILPNIPPGHVLVAESAIRSGNDARLMRSAGADGVLVGEALVRSPDVVQMIADFKKPFIPKLKLCGISDMEIANSIVHEGLCDIIGLVFVPHSPHYMSDLDLARRIVEMCGKKVDVWGSFANHSVDEVCDIVQKTGIRGVQFHGDRVRSNFKELHQRLHPSISRIIVCPESHSEWKNEVSSIMPLLHRDRDYILYDCLKPGSGEEFSLDVDLVPTKSIPFILTRGLNDTDDIVDALINFSPTVVDISSATDNSAGVTCLDSVRNVKLKVESAAVFKQY